MREKSRISSISEASASTGGADRVEIALLLGRERRARHQVGHAENAVERRAHLMADGREKARFRLVGGFRAVARRRRSLQIGDFVAQPGDEAAGAAPRA
jgi:hypothetical protein